MVKIPGNFILVQREVANASEKFHVCGFAR